MNCTLLQVPLRICSSPWKMFHCLGSSISCGLKCNPASSPLLLAMNSHNLFTEAMTLPNIDGYNSDVLTTEEESMTFTFYILPVSRISKTYVILPKYNGRYQAYTKFGAVSVCCCWDKELLCVLFHKIRT